MEILEYLWKFHPVVLHLPIGALYLTFCLVLLEKFFKNNYTIPVRFGLLFSFTFSVFFSSVTVSNPKDVVLTVIETYRYLLMALEKLHTAKILHFDLKMENILFTKGTTDPRIIDFGISIPMDKLSDKNKVPQSGLNFLIDAKLDRDFLLLCGFEKFKEFFVRIDILEKLFLKIIEKFDVS